MNKIKTNLLLSIVTIFVTSVAVAQDIKQLSAGTHITNNTINIFEGKWQSINTSFILELDLSKTSIPIGSAKIDAIIGFHTLIVDDKIVFRNERPKDLSNLFKLTSFSAKGDNSDKNAIEGYFVLEKGSRYKVSARLSDDKQEMTLVLYPSNPQGIIINEEPTPEVYKLPGKIVLKRKI